MKTKFMLLATLLTLTSLAFVQIRQSPQQAGDNPTNPGLTTCSYTFKTGSGWNATQFCVTANGNITQFSRPNGVEYIAFGTYGEGYGICDLTYDPPESSYDYAGYGASGVGAPTLISLTDSSVKISRDIGAFTLTQTITMVKATATAPGAAKVTMTLKNENSEKRAVGILRYADIDIDDLNHFGNFNNDFDHTNDTAYGLERSTQFGLASVNNTFSPYPSRNWNAVTRSVPSGPDPCRYTQPEAPQPFVGDGSVLQYWGLAIGSGSSKTVVMTYKPI